MMIDEDDDGDDYKDDISTIWNCTSYKSHIDVSDDDDACEAQPRYSGWGCAVSSKMAAIGSRWHTETPLSYTADQLQLLAICYSPKIVHFSLRREKLKCCTASLGLIIKSLTHTLLQFNPRFESTYMPSPSTWGNLGMNMIIVTIMLMPSPRVCHENTSNLSDVRKCECKRLAKVNPLEQF